MRTIVKVVAGFSVVLLAALVLGTAVLAALLQTDPGRDLARGMLERGLDGALPGSVRIARLERFGWFRPSVTRLEFRDPKGSVVLQVEHATLVIAPWPLLRGVVEVPWARTEGGYIVIAVQPNGRTGLESAFATPEQPEDAQREDDGAVVHFRRIEVADLNAVLRPSRDQTIKIRNLGGVVRIDREKQQGVRVRLQGLRGRVSEPELVGEKLRLLRVDGWVHGDEPHVLQLAFWTAVGTGQGRVDGTLSLFDRAREPLQVRLEPHDGAKAHLAAALVLLQSWGTSDVSVKLGTGS